MIQNDFLGLWQTKYDDTLYSAELNTHTHTDCQGKQGQEKEIMKYTGMYLERKAASLLREVKIATMAMYATSKKPDCLDLIIPAITIGISFNRARLRETECGNKRDTIRKRIAQTSVLLMGRKVSRQVVMVRISRPLKFSCNWNCSCYHPLFVIFSALLRYCLCL